MPYHPDVYMAGFSPLLRRVSRYHNQKASKNRADDASIKAGIMARWRGVRRTRGHLGDGSAYRNQRKGKTYQRA